MKQKILLLLPPEGPDESPLFGSSQFDPFQTDVTLD